MRAIIVIPRSPFLDDDHVFPHLGPYYIKRYVEENSTHEVDVIHDHIPTKFEEYDIVGIHSTTPQYESALDIVSCVSTEKLVVLGGPHATFYDPPVGNFNVVIRGDGCKPFLNILNGDPPGDCPDDADQLPYRGQYLHDYTYILDGAPATVVITSRGCPNNCAFCEHANTALRLKSPKALEQEIQECVDLGFTRVMFFDDLFCLNSRRVDKLCTVIENFDIKFRCFAHARNFTSSMAERLARAGCVEIGYGAESCYQPILDTINKRTTVQQNYEIIQTAHEHGIRVKAFLLMGLPGECPESVAAMEKFVKTSCVDDFDVTIYYPYRGTRIADYIDEYDLQIVDSGIGWYKGRGGAAECITRTKALSSAEILAAKDRVYAYKRLKK